MAIRRNKEEIDYRAKAEARPERAAGERQTFADGGRAWLSNVKKQRKPATHEFYSQRFRVAQPWMQANGVEYVDQLVPKKLEQYRDWRLDYMGVSSATVRHDEVAMKQLTQYARKKEGLTYDPLRDYDCLDAPKGERAAADLNDLHKILKEIETTHLHVDRKNYAEMKYVNSRDRMVLLTLIETGARSGEVLCMTRESLLRERGMIHFTKSGMAESRKNGDPLTVQAQKYWWTQLDAYIEIREPMTSDKDLVFPLINGRPMNSRQWAERFATYRRAASVNGLTSHAIRHMVGGKVAEAKGLFAVTRQLGQRSTQSAERYTKHAGKDDAYLKEVHDAVSPLTAFASATGRLEVKKSRKHTAYRQ